MTQLRVDVDWRDIFRTVRLALPSTTQGKPICWVACSGGLDSTVLLQAVGKMAAMSEGEFPEVRALHINHQLSPQAGLWAAQCKLQAKQLNFACEVVKVRVTKRGAGLEAAARQVRYQVFEAKLDEGDSLLLGHHLNDQAETVLFRLFRGHGLAGLAGIPDHRPLGRGVLYRPLLNIPRSRLENLAIAWGLSWFDDESNFDQSLDRNYIRHRVMRSVLYRWPSALQRIGTSAQWLREAQALNEALAAIDLETVALDTHSLSLEPFTLLPSLRQKNLIKFWLQQRCQVVISERHLTTVLSVISRATAKPSQVRLDNDTELFISGGAVTCLRLSNLLAARKPLIWHAADQQTRMAGETPYGELQLVFANEPTDNRLLLRQPRQNETISVRYREGGERFRPHGRGGGCSLKKWLQEKGIPGWQRNLIPLIYYDQRLAAVAGTVAGKALAIDEDYGVTREGLQMVIK